MEIQISIDHLIEGRDVVATETTDIVTHALKRFSPHITRLEVHVEDENGPKGGAANIRCMLEARLEHRQPAAVTDHAATVIAAVRGATHKLVALLDSTMGRDEAKRRTTPV